VTPQPRSMATTVTRASTWMTTPSEPARASGVLRGQCDAVRPAATLPSAASRTKLSGIVQETADQTGECLMLRTRFTFSEKISKFDFGRRCAG
jgi:hypothetical protein